MEMPLVQQWITWQTAGRLSAVTVTERARVVAQFLTDADTTEVDATHHHVVKWLAEHPEWSASTSATYHSYLRAFFAWMAMLDHRTDNPMLKIPPPRYPDRVPRPVTDSDFTALLATPMHHRTRVMILLAALAGLRVSEVAQVRGEDVDPAGGRLFVRGKGGSVNWLPLHPLLVEAAATMPLRGYWFPANSRRSGSHIHPKSVSSIIGAAMRRAGCRGTAHSLRHWHGTTLLADGADLRTVQELLRHKSVATTQIYTKVPDGRRRDAVHKLDPFRGVA